LDQLLHSRYFRALLGLAFAICAILVAWLAISMLAEGAAGRGPAVGNLFLIGFGVLLFVFTPLLLIVGIINWRKVSRVKSKNEGL